jgi:CO/xanthine dehydrogenase Mo-binding subunit
MEQAESSSIRIQADGNVLKHCVIQRGAANIADAFAAAAHVVEGVYHTQRVEHAFLETEAALAEPWQADGIQVRVQSQGIYEDRRQIAAILNMPESKVQVILAPCGGAFGGKEDLTVQGHAALFSYVLKRPVRVRLSRPESLRMHPKRHPMRLTYKLACDRDGRLTALQARILGDSGAYASVGAEVLERAAAHASGAYWVPQVDIEAKAVYTNNIPSGAMRGFGVNQVTFAMESAVDALCEQGGFDRWQFRYDNALTEGQATATGQVLGPGVGLRETLRAVQDEFRQARYAGLACGLKNCGIGNGIIEHGAVKLEVRPEARVILHHGWSEVGQGVDTVAQQILCEALGRDTPKHIEVKTDSAAGAPAGVTTASRATMLLGNAILDAARQLKQDLAQLAWPDLVGKVYEGNWQCDWTTAPGTAGEVVSHFAYSYATHLVVLDPSGRIDTVIAAHDAGKVVNPTLLEGQIEGAVVMGLGYALSENLPMPGGYLKSDRLAQLGLLRARDVPRIIVKAIEVADPCGPLGAKGVGEIGTVPTAAAVANALYQFDRVRRYALPLKPRSSRQKVEEAFTAEDA